MSGFLALVSKRDKNLFEKQIIVIHVLQVYDTVAFLESEYNINCFRFCQ